VLIKVPIEVGADAESVRIRSASFPPEAIVGPRVNISFGIGDQQEIPVVGVQKFLVLGQLVDCVEQGGGSDPLSGMHCSVEEDTFLVGAVGYLDGSEASALRGRAEGDDGHQLWEGGDDFVNVGPNLKILYSLSNKFARLLITYIG
jgi:hypothetical protein